MALLDDLYEREHDAQAVLDEIGADFSVHDKIQKLNLGQWKIIEIARGLAYHLRLFFLMNQQHF
jgi:ABC-type sugar transport system ATPase subunit